VAEPADQPFGIGLARAFLKSARKQHVPQHGVVLPDPLDFDTGRLG
jgi:hypothetical protein